MSKSIYAICVTRHYYAPQPNTKRRLLDDHGAEWVGTRAEARAKIRELDGTLYYLSHNESDRPDYTIVRR